MEPKKEFMAKKTTSTTRCPICSSIIYECEIDSTNLQFLNERLLDAKLNETITLTRVIWDAFPQRRTEADAEVIIQHLSKTMLTTLQTQINEILKPIHELIETLPNSVRKNIEEKFDETKRRLEEEFKTLREAAPTFESVTDALQAIANKIEDITKKEISKIEQELAEKFRATLEKAGLPQGEQVKLLAQLVPAVLPLLEELVRFQKIPEEKGRRGETEVIEELNNFYPEDEYENIGGPGDIDIIAKPRHNGTNLENKILIESKKNNSGWRRSYIQQVQRHMKMRGECFAILTVEVMPMGANGFLVEHCSEGVIFVTSRENFKIAYGALRSALIALHPLKREVMDLRKAFADKRVEEAIKDAYRYKEHIKKIRQKAERIVTNAKGITQDTDDLEDCLKECLKELQYRISRAIQDMERTSPTNNGCAEQCYGAQDL